jgi:restriction system protein
MSTNVYVVRADYGKYTPVFEKEGYVAIGWFTIDPQDWDLTDKEFIKAHYRQSFPSDSPMRSNQNVGQIYRFVSEIKVGDVVVCPFQDNQLLVGTITGDLYYSNDATSRFLWRRRVKWHGQKIDRHLLSVPLQNTLRATLTCFKVNAGNEILEKLGLDIGQGVDSNASFHSAISNTELIRQRFLQLDATEFEYLVSYLLRTLGFEPSQEIGKVGDGGIDFEGILDVSGIASINLQVQVKRFDKGVIGEKEIRNFRVH